MPHASIHEPSRQVPVALDCDIVVIGGSCTGVFAAVRAARLGARVAIVEKQNCFGGVATAGLVNIWHSLHDTEGKQRIIGGLTAEVIERLRKRDAVAEIGNVTNAFLLNTEELKIELDELIVEHHITPFLHSFYAAPVVEDGRLAAVILENKDGRQAIRARQFIDATGDGDVAVDLNLSAYRHAACQPPTLCAKIAGFDTLRDFDWQAAIREHGHEFALQKDWGWGCGIPGIPNLHMRADTHVFGINAASGRELTNAEIEGRRQVRAMLDVIRKYGPAGNAVALASLAAVIGIRETRHIAASYQLTGDDVLYGRRFDDAIANGSYRVDIHHAENTGITFRYLDGAEETISERGQPAIHGRWRDPLPTDPTCYQIPYRCLVQQHVPNLIMAGRMLDADPIAFSAARVMVNLNQTGEAAGVAAWLALDEGVSLADIDVARLRNSLAKGGSIIL